MIRSYFNIKQSPSYNNIIVYQITLFYNEDNLITYKLSLEVIFHNSKLTIIVNGNALCKGGNSDKIDVRPGVISGFCYNVLSSLLDNTANMYDLAEHSQDIQSFDFIFVNLFHFNYYIMHSFFIILYRHFLQAVNRNGPNPALILQLKNGNLNYMIRVVKHLQN